MARHQFRVFVSSPGDVTAAREVTAQVIEKLAHEYARFFAIEPYLWEYEPMLASGHFQDSIDPPSKFDAVILILESRLGTPLPERTAVREYRGMDGRAPVTGTEWEYEDALVAARASGAPDLLVYRSRRKAEIDIWDPASRQAVLKQIDALDDFWSRHFANRGSFIGGYAEFRTLEEFAGRLEEDLRVCVRRRLERLQPEERAARTRLWSSEPFRGLEAYELKHAPIFFGREEAIGAALLRLNASSQAGRPFLLISGASGSGKSSLVKAGLLPRLLVPQRVSGIAFLRRVVFRPGDRRAGEDLFDALARCLITGDADGTGLPELLGSSMTVKDLARHLRENPAHPDMPFAMALDRLAETAQAQGRMLRYEQPRLILEVDQLEELFTAEHVGPQERTAFVQLLGGLVQSGLVWVTATLRSDFWHRASETPELMRLAERDGRLDLLPPSSAELSQMIRGPAEAASVHFERHPATGIPLNDVIAEAATNEPGALPLLSYLLNQLYQKDVQDAGGDTLTYASYNALGGLKGAIATRADAVIAAQPLEAREALRPVLFALVQMSAGDGGVERAVARRAPLADFPQGTPRRQLIEALLEPSARLVVADAVGGDQSCVRLAHEALISEWTTARNYVAANAEALKTRRMLEERYTRWQALRSERDIPRRHPALQGTSASFLRGRFAREQGLLTDVDLIDARRLLQNYPGELSSKLISYIQRSVEQYHRRRQRAFRMALAAAVLLGVLAVGASYEASVASTQREAALHAQIRSLAQTAAGRLSQGDAPGALALVLEIFPREQRRLPYSADVLGVYQEARALDARAILTMTGDDGELTSATFSPDDRSIVTAGYGKKARIWDASTGRAMRVLGEGSAHSATFSPDGKSVVTASRARPPTINLWDAASGRLLRRMTGHAMAVITATFSPDGRRILSASRDKTARIWDESTGREVVQLVGHSDEVRSAAFSPDGRRVVTASFDGTARIWDASTGRQIMVLRGHAGHLEGAAFSPDGRRVVTAADDHTARIWDAATGAQTVLLTGHDNWVYSAQFSPDGKLVVTASEDRTVRLWDSSTGQEVARFVGHKDAVYFAAFSPTGGEVVSASRDATARVWEVTPSRQVLMFGEHKQPLDSVAFSPDARYLVISSANNATILDAGSGSVITVLIGHTALVESAMFSPDGDRVLTASYDQTARVWDRASGRQIMTLHGHTAQLVSAAFSPDGRRIVTTSLDKTARLWDAATGRQILVLDGHHDRVIAAAFAPDGSRVVTGSSDKTARVWDAETGRQLLVLSGHTDELQAVAYSPDGDRIVTASIDKTARVWDAKSGQQILALQGHRDGLAGVAYSADGRRIVTASHDQTARIWDAQTGEQILALTGHTGGVESAVFSPDGRHVATASDDGTGRIWDPRARPLDVQIASSNAAEFDPLGQEERFQLGLPASQDVREWSNPSKCDQAAAAPYDPDRRAQGVWPEDIVPDLAISSCRDALRETDSARAAYQYGRALVANGDLAAGKQQLERALAAGYRAAGFDLAMLLSQPSRGMTDLPRAVSLLERGSEDGVEIAAFELGSLYEHGVHQAGDSGVYSLIPDRRKASVYYQKAASAGQPQALARFADDRDRSALAAQEPAERNAQLLRAFTYYASAAERARLEDWPDSAWRDWRYRRASIARLLAHKGMVEQVAHAYEAVRGQYAPRPSAWQRLRSSLGIE